MPDTLHTKHAKQSDKAVGHRPEVEEDSPHMWEKILESMNKRFDLLEQKFETLMNTPLALTERLVVAEEQGSDHERRIQMLELCLTEMKKSNERLLTKIGDLEGRSRRNNIKIVGIPEGEEKGRPTEFITGLIPKLLRESNFAKPVMVDPLDVKRPRSIIARIHFYQEKELILRLSRQQQLTYNGHRVYVYPDYTAEVMA